MSLRRLLRTHLGPYRRLLTIVVVLQAIQTTAALTLPSLNADIIDKGVLRGDDGYIWRTGGVMLVFSFIQIVFAVGAVRFGAQAAMSFGRDLRRDIFHQVTSYSAREVGKFGAPSLITRVTNDVQQVQMLVVLTCTMMIAAPITMVFGIVFAIREDVGLSVIMLVAIPILIGVLAVIISQMVPTFQQMQLRIDRINAVLREQITGIRVVRAFVREPEEVQRFAQANNELTATSLRAGRLMSLMFPTVTFFISVSSVAVLWLGADRINAGDMELGSVVAYLSYLVQVLVAVVMLTFMVSMLPRAAVAAERIVEVLDTNSSVVPPESPITKMPERGTVEFTDVSFTYPGAESPVLCDLSFKITPGRTTAIIGSTGSGNPHSLNWSRGCPMPHPARWRSTASTSVCSTPTCSLDRSAISRRRPSCSVAQSHRISDSVDPRPPMTNCGQLSKSHRPRASCNRCPTGSTAGSPRAAPTCLVASVSASPLHEHSLPGPTSTYSMTRSLRSTSPPMLDSGLR